MTPVQLFQFANRERVGATEAVVDECVGEMADEEFSA
jgi:hypothetical protein